MPTGSRWGLTGVEDLGGGLQTIFTLENGFDLNTGELGQGGRESWDGKAFMGLASANSAPSLSGASMTW